MNPSRETVRYNPASHPQSELLLKSHKWPQLVRSSLKRWRKLTSKKWWRAKGKWWRTGDIFQCASKEKISGQGLCCLQQPVQLKECILRANVQALRLKLCTDSATIWRKSRNTCSPWHPPLRGPISPVWCFSSLSHSSSLRAASACNHLIASPIILQICHRDKVSHADSQWWKSSNNPFISEAACCHGH